jgi:hypothetical protein
MNNLQTRTRYESDNGSQVYLVAEIEKQNFKFR